MTPRHWIAGPRVEPIPLSPRRIAQCALFASCVLAFLMLLGDRLLQDGDTFWHIVVGERMLDRLAMPRVDEFSHSAAGAPWIAKEWLAQLLLALAWRAGGWGGVVLLAGASFAAACGLLFAFLLRRVKPTLALVLVLLVLPLAAGQVLARPQIFYFPMLVLWLGGLIAAAERGAPPPWRLVLVMVLWTNLHPSFPVGFVLAALLAAEAVLGATPADRIRLALRWLVFGLVALAATGLTPYGYAPLLLAIETYGANQTLQFINEWQPLQPEPGLLLPILCLALALLPLLRAGPGPRLAPVALTAWLMVRHARFSGLFAIVAAMAAAGPLGARLPAYGPVREEGARAAWPLRTALGAVLALAVLLPVLLRPAPPPGIAPAAALEAAQREGAAGPGFHAFEFGGFLIWRGVPTFIDGRTDQLFLGDFVPALLAAEQDASDAPFLALLDRHRAGWALVLTESAAARKLDRAPGWRRVHRDEVASAYLRR